MKKWLLLCCCIFIVGCSKSVADPTEDLSRYQTWIAREMDKTAPIKEIHVSAMDSDTYYLKAVHDPKEIESLLDQLKSIEYTGESSGVPCGESISLSLFDEQNKSYNFGLSQACATTDFYPKTLTYDHFDYQKFYEAIQVKEWTTPRNNPLSRDLGELRINEFNIITNCIDKVCDAFGVKQEDSSSLSLRDFLNTLKYGEEIKKPKKGTQYLLTFPLQEGNTYCLIENENEIAVGTPKGAWYSVDYFNQSIQTFISKLPKTQLDDPRVKTEFVYEDGVGRKLEEYGLVTKEDDPYNFTSNSYSSMPIRLQVDKGQLFIGAKQNRFDYLYDISDTSGMHGELCIYYPSTQTAKGCTLDEARLEYVTLHEEVQTFLSEAKMSLDEFIQWTIEVKQAEMKRIIANEEVLSIEKTWIGNVIDIEHLLIQDGYVKKGQYFYKKVGMPIVGVTAEKDRNYQYLVLDPYKMSLFFGNQQAGASIPFNSQIGTYQHEETICDYDFETNKVIGECQSDQQYYDNPPYILTQRVYWTLLHRFTLTSEDLIQYSQMIQASEPSKNEPYDFTGL